MTPDDFRRHGHDIVDWIADYLGAIETYPVRAQTAPGDILAQLADAPPEAGEPIDAIFNDFLNVILPGMTHWQHPSFFAYFPANASPPSLLAEMLTSALAAQCMLWQTSPAATELETRMMQWLRAMIGLPQWFSGVIHDSATSATLAALLVARERATGWRANEDGLGALGTDGTQLVVYTSEEAHSSIEKTMKVAGYGGANLRKIAADDDFAMDIDALRAAIGEDLSKGLTPACVVASIGGTGTGAIDPLRAIGEICSAHEIWLHVDAAWAGTALILPEHRAMIDGIEHADSFVFNPHKWMLVHFDCTAFFVRDPEALERTLSLVPEYLKSREGDEIVDYQNWSVPLGRRFRALKLWFVLRSYGIAGIRNIIRNHIALAAELYARVHTEADFEIMSPLRLALFSFRHRPHAVDDEAQIDAHNRALLDRLNDSGKLYLTQTLVRGRYAIRFQVGQTTTERRHVHAAWSLIRETARTPT